MSNESEEAPVVEQVETEVPAVVNVANVFAPPPVRNSRPVSIEQTETTHPLVRLAMESGPLDTANLSALMTLQREWEAGEAKKSYTRAMVDMKRELPTVLARDKRVSFETRGGGATTYTHTSLAAAVEAITPHVCNHGFSLDFKTRSTDKGHVEVTATITHRDGHSECCTLAGPPETSGTKNAVQAVASTVTLLERYTMLALLGIATKDHTDPVPSGSTPNAPKTVDEILAMFGSAKARPDVVTATAAWTAIKSTLNEDDRDQLTLAREEAIARIKGAA